MLLWKILLAFTGKRTGKRFYPLLSRESSPVLIKVYDKKGSIADGKDADIVLLDAENDIADVLLEEYHREVEENKNSVKI